MFYPHEPGPDPEENAAVYVTTFRGGHGGVDTPEHIQVVPLVGQDGVPGEREKRKGVWALECMEIGQEREEGYVSQPEELVGVIKGVLEGLPHG